MANTYVLIASSTVGSGGSSTITFSSIPSTYTDLKIVYSARDNRATNDGDDLIVRINGVSTGTPYSNIRLYGNGSSTGSDKTTSTNSAYAGMVSTTSQTASTFGNGEFYFPNYTSTTLEKSMLGDAVAENNSSTAIQALSVWLSTNTAAIGSITITPQNGTAFVEYSTFYLYGIKNS